LRRANSVARQIHRPMIGIDVETPLAQKFLDEIRSRRRGLLTSAKLAGDTSRGPSSNGTILLRRTQTGRPCGGESAQNTCQFL
jgi:hypothetical protein